MQKKYLALLHKIGFTHKILFKIFEKDNWNFEDFYENLSFSNLEKYKIEKIKIEKILEQKKLIDKDKIFQKLDELESISFILLITKAFLKKFWKKIEL